MFATNTGLAKLKEGKVDEAIETFQRAVQLDPTNAQAFYNLARALQKKGQREEARTAERKARELDPRLKPLP
jgi:Flp pilus assembly protein TadD